jgi:NAD(P)-dependent dehydrogenase (short-subunit alcohol dehydrogenase family)
VYLSHITDRNLKIMTVIVRHIGRTPMKKIATPEEVATQIVLLSSEKVSSHTTGEITMLAGGMEGEFHMS